MDEAVPAQKRQRRGSKDELAGAEASYHVQFGTTLPGAAGPPLIDLRDRLNNQFQFRLITHVRLLLRGLAASLHKLLRYAAVHRSRPLPRSSLTLVLSIYQTRELLRPVSQEQLLAVS